MNTHVFNKKVSLSKISSKIAPSAQMSSLIIAIDVVCQKVVFRERLLCQGGTITRLWKTD